MLKVCWNHLNQEMSWSVLKYMNKKNLYSREDVVLFSTAQSIGYFPCVRLTSLLGVQKRKKSTISLSHTSALHLSWPSQLRNNCERHWRNACAVVSIVISIWKYSPQAGECHTTTYTKHHMWGRSIINHRKGQSEQR